ncbi:hypothetical protein ACOME3_000618 [Neoechinorhynchus agilis]
MNKWYSNNDTVETSNERSSSSSLKSHLFLRMMHCFKSDEESKSSSEVRQSKSRVRMRLVQASSDSEVDDDEGPDEYGIVGISGDERIIDLTDENGRELKQIVSKNVTSTLEENHISAINRADDEQNMDNSTAEWTAISIYEMTQYRPQNYATDLVVRISVIDRQTGKYSRSSKSKHEFVVPALTHEINISEGSVPPKWNEIVLIDESLKWLISNKVIVLFEVIGVKRKCRTKVVKPPRLICSGFFDAAFLQDDSYLMVPLYQLKGKCSALTEILKFVHSKKLKPYGASLICKFRSIDYGTASSIIDDTKQRMECKATEDYRSRYETESVLTQTCIEDEISTHQFISGIKEGSFEKRLVVENDKITGPIS